MALLKSQPEIEVLKTGGKILSEILKLVAKKAQAGVTTEELDELAEKLILEQGGEPSFKGYGDHGPVYPATLCTSINEQVVHGVPGGAVLKEGDILSLDIGMKYPKKSGLFTDMAVTVAIGKIGKDEKKLIKVTRKALDIWLNKIKPEADLNAIARQVQQYVESNGFSVIRELAGHGVGHAVHEPPMIPNYYTPNHKFILKEGMVLVLEPMVSSGDYRIKTLSDGWTIVTLDKSLCAHFEHTVAVTKKGCEVLTK
jgi:methionyl aminopeptidase